MRVVHAAVLTTAALLLASVASAQGLGDAAAREKEKRKATPPPAKVYTESDIGRSMAPVSSTPDLPAAADPAGPAGAPVAEGQAPVEGQPAVTEPAPGEPAAEGAAAPAADAAASAAQKAAEEQRAAAIAAWKQRVDQAKKEEAAYKDVIDKVQADLNDITGGVYSPGRASKIAFLDETKQRLAETQGRIAALEEEGRRNRY